jgi:hypothetical protein
LEANPHEKQQIFFVGANQDASNQTHIESQKRFGKMFQKDLSLNKHHHVNLGMSTSFFFQNKIFFECFFAINLFSWTHLLIS